MTVIMAEEEKDGCPRCSGKVSSNFSTMAINIKWFDLNAIQYVYAIMNLHPFLGL